MDYVYLWLRKIMKKKKIASLLILLILFNLFTYIFPYNNSGSIADQLVGSGDAFTVNAASANSVGGSLSNGNNSSVRRNSSAIEIAGNATTTDANIVPSDGPLINAASAIVMDVDTGDILYEKYAHERHYPASITKVMTCLLAVENGNVNDEITVSENVMSQVEMDSSRIGLQAGETLTLRDALYGMMLNSGNECALTIAEYVSGSTESFADMMNERARKLGCTDTHFVNPNGIHNEEHYTSCYDMALIGCAAYQYPEFKKLISSQSYTIPETNLNEARDLWQENRLIWAGNKDYYYQYCTGGKTGYTETSLATLISFSERDGRRFVTVVMKCNPTTESYSDTIKLCEFCYNKYKLCKPLTEFSFSSPSDEEYSLLSNYYNDLNHELPKYYVNQSYSFYIRSHVDDTEIEKNITYLDRPVGNTAGKITFWYRGNQLGAVDITVRLPSVVASSTDAIIESNNEPEPVPKYKTWTVRAVLIAIILFLLILIVILVVKIFKQLRYYNVKSTVKYYPISRDMRIKANQERLKKEKAERDEIVRKIENKAKNKK